MRNGKTMIAVTDFSASAANALDYACEFARDSGLQVVVANINNIPTSYAADGLSIAAINDEMDATRYMLDDELARIKDNYPGVTVEGRMATGNFLESLQALKNELGAELVIIGAAGEYSELRLWDDDWLHALVNLSGPVLVIPPGVRYKAFRKVAFAYDYKKVCSAAQTGTIEKLLRLSGASFHIVHVVAEAETNLEPQKIAAFKEGLNDLNPEFHTIENKFVIRGLAEFVKRDKIDLLLVVPRKHGLWYNLFNKSYTKQLALLKDLPVMVLHDND